MKFFYFFLLYSFFGYTQQPSHLLLGDEELAGINVYSIIQDTDKSIVLSTNNGLFRYNSLNFEIINTQTLGDQSLFGLTKGTNDVIFCYNLSGEIFYLKDNKLYKFFTVPKKYLTSVIQIIIDDQNHIVVYCKKVLRVAPNGTYETLFSPKSPESSSLATDKDGKIYFYDSHSIYSIKGKTVNFEYKISFESNNLLKPYSTNSGTINLHVNTLAKGYIVKDKKLTEVNYKTPLDKTANYNYFISKTKPIIWLSSSKNGIYAYNLDGKPLFNNQLLFKDYFISSYLEDSEGNFWLTTFGKGIIFIPNLNVIEYTNNDLLDKEDLLRITKKGPNFFLVA